MAEYTLKFSPSLLEDTGAYKLLELPAELHKLVEAGSSSSSSPSLVIKGNQDEDAVLCTGEKTYAIRSVVLSNSVLVVTPGPAEEDDEGVAAVIRDQVKEVLELTPSVPRLHKLDALLRGGEYEEGREDDEDFMSDEDGESQRRKPRRLSYEEARRTLQASEVELAQGLKNKRVLILGGTLRPLAPSYLTSILELLLTHLVSLSQPHDAASVGELTSALGEGYDIRQEVCEQVIRWFGDVQDGKWNMNVAAVVKEVGLGILRSYRHDAIPQDEFLAKWRTSVGDTFESESSMDLLSGNYLSRTDTMKDPPVTTLTYFPSSELPIDPASRFVDLFLSRARWKAEEITPFLADIVVEAKERDKLLLKYTRAITDAQGVWYTARAKYSG